MTPLRHTGLALFLPVLLSACAATNTTTQASGPPPMSHPEGAIFDPALDASAAVDAALERARETDRLVLLVMGANWCHDSRALTSALMEPELAALLEEHFEPVYIDVGLPQTGDGFNLDIPRRFGVEPQGTPNVLVLTGEGELVNTQDDAVSWRNSASRTPEQIRAPLEGFATSR